MMDFTPEIYSRLLDALGHREGLTLRHDVDLQPERSVEMAKLEAENGYEAIYYFRANEIVNDPTAIRTISGLGHRIGYHYESLAACRGDMAKAFADFKDNLHRIRQIADVTTACAHGSPRSPWNSEELWQHYDRKALGIDYEPMLDTDFSNTLYLTDTGRRWDGYRMAVRDKVPERQEQWRCEGLAFHSTEDIIAALRNPAHPIHQKALLINTHPQRWMPFGGGWIKEYIMQNAKNLAKQIIVCAKS